MNIQYSALPVTTLSGSYGIVYPEPTAQLTMDDPAMLAMTDFRKKRPSLLNGNLSVNEARHLMKTDDESIELVVNQSGELIGIITLKDILGKKALAKAHAMGVRLEEIQVTDIMQPRNQLAGIHMRHFEDVRIGDVIETFNLANTEYLLVIENDREQPSKTYLRGLVSTAEIARRLDISLDINARAKSFSDIVYAVHGHFE